jgi:hypothetical protein
MYYQTADVTALLGLKCPDRPNNSPIDKSFEKNLMVKFSLYFFQRLGERRDAVIILAIPQYIANAISKAYSSP